MQLTLRDASDEMVGDGYLGGLSTFRTMPGNHQSPSNARLDDPFLTARGRGQHVADRRFRGCEIRRVATSTTRPEAGVNTDRQRKDSCDFSPSSAEFGRCDCFVLIDRLDHDDEPSVCLIAFHQFVSQTAHRSYQKRVFEVELRCSDGCHGGNLRLHSPLPLRVTSGGRPSLICDSRYAEMNCGSPFLTRVSQ